MQADDSSVKDTQQSRTHAFPDVRFTAAYCSTGNRNRLCVRPDLNIPFGFGQDKVSQLCTIPNHIHISRITVKYMDSSRPESMDAATIPPNSEKMSNKSSFLWSNCQEQNTHCYIHTECYQSQGESKYWVRTYEYKGFIYFQLQATPGLLS
jgi:hypothetical protein